MDRIELMIKRYKIMIEKHKNDSAKVDFYNRKIKEWKDSED